MDLVCIPPSFRAQSLTVQYFTHLIFPFFHHFDRLSHLVSSFNSSQSYLIASLFFPFYGSFEDPSLISCCNQNLTVPFTTAHHLLVWCFITIPMISLLMCMTCRVLYKYFHANLESTLVSHFTCLLLFSFPLHHTWNMLNFPSRILICNCIHSF